MKKPKLFIKLRGIFLERLCLRTSNPTEKNLEREMDNTGEESDSGDDDFDRQYWPHQWSTKFETPEEVLQQYINFITTESELATDSIAHELKVRYGSAKGQKLDILGTDLPDDAPILVYVHGGYWTEISRKMSRFLAIPLHKAGVKTFVVGYSRRRRVTLWDIEDQVQDAIMYALKYAEEKGSRGAYLVGHGSGAHLIARAFSCVEFVRCHAMKLLNGVVLISGLYDLRNFSLTTANYRVKISKIDEISFSQLYNDYTHLEHSKIRFYILAAEEDSPMYKSQARDFYNLLFDICPMGNLYLEIKDNMDHYDMVKCLTNEDNYLRNLILHDLRKHSNDYVHRPVACGDSK